MKKVLSATTLKGSDKGKLLEVLLEITDAVPLPDDRYSWDIKIHDEPDSLGVTFIVKWYDEDVDQWYCNIEEYGITIDEIIANNDFYEDMIEFLSHEVEDSGYIQGVEEHEA